MIEHGCAIASLSMGETVQNVARGIDCYSFKVNFLSLKNSK